MAIINQAWVDGANAVVRAVELHARQTAATAVSSALTSGATPSPTSAIDTAASTVAPQQTSTADPGNTGGGGGGGSSGGTSSPLLFFVALGFGVVFTNLWIIVGVKYCFRYNARNRALRGLDENGEPINLENMPARPHRRRREKKLMTMDEVNEKFPMTKYKAWVAGRAKEGLPTAGGVSAPPSRANSVRSIEAAVPELPSKEHDSADAIKSTDAPETETKAQVTSGSGVANDDDLIKAPTAGSIVTKDPDHEQEEEDEEDEHIDAALPPEMMGTPGDTCAICIDTLEDDDDVRGLTCGHAFHAVCLDPWLTNRRACCPLCKADYYTPKPRPPPIDGNPSAAANADSARSNGRMNMPRSPQRTFTGWTLRGNPRIMGNRFGPRRATDGDRQRIRADTANSPEQQGWLGRVRGRLPNVRMPALGRGAQSNSPEVAESGGGNTTTTPSQLEAGARPAGN